MTGQYERRATPHEDLYATRSNKETMSESDRPSREAEGEEADHPLKAGIDAAKDGDTASLEDILSELE